MPEQPDIGPIRRQRAGLVRVGYGLHRIGGEDEDEAARLALDAAAWQTTLPESACFGHLTSARLRRLWLPPLPDDLPVFVAQHRRHAAAERPELRVSRHPIDPPWDELGGLRVLTLPETLLACARHLGTLDLLVLLDCVLHHGWCSREELGRAAAVPRRRGAPRLRAALELADGRSESPWETLLRILHVVCGIAVEPQHDLHDASGAFVARGDLWLVGSQALHEYDGGEHLERPRQRKDLKRVRRIGHENWERRGYTKEDVLTQGVTILRDADATIGRDHDPARIRPWHELLRQSLFTPSGAAAFRARIRLPPTSGERAS